MDLVGVGLLRLLVGCMLLRQARRPSVLILILGREGVGRRMLRL